MIRFLQTPGPVKKIILGGLLLLICGAMVISFVPGGLGSELGLGGLGQGVVARVDGEDITTLEVQRRAEQMVKQQFPRGGPQMEMFRSYFASQALEGLVAQQTLLTEARRMGLRATNAEVRDELEHGRLAATFFPGGNFIGQAAYEDLLQRNDLTVPIFENEIKHQILIDKLRNLVTGSATVTDLEVRREFEQKNARVKFDYAVLTRDDILKTIHPAEAELKAFYERNKTSYQNSIPEKRKIRYALIDTAKLGTEVSRDELQSYYNNHREEYRVPEEVNVRHILIKTPLPGADGKTDPKGTEEARKKAEDVLKQLKAGAKFEDLAKKHSDDPGSGSNGGSLGWIGKGRTVPEFEKEAFSLPKGGTSGLVQSTYGFHIIRVDDKHDAHVKTLDEVKAQIEPIIRQEKSAQAADNKAGALLTAARANGLDKAAAAQGLQVVSTDFFARNDSLPGIGYSPQFADAVFGQQEKAPPDRVQIANGSVVFEVTGIQPPATPTFEQIRSRVENEFKNERATALLTQKTQELSDRAKAAHDLKRVAREMGATVKTSDLVAPDGQVPDIGSMSGPASVAFTMKPGEISGPIQNGASGAVLSVIDRQQPSAEDFAAKKDDVRDSLLQAKRAELFEVFLASRRDQLEKDKKIVRSPDEMKKLTGSTPGEQGG